MKRFLLPMGLLALIACDGGFGVPVCTQKPCGPTLLVEIQGDLPSTYTVTLAGEGMEPIELECPASRCGPPIFVLESTPESVTVQVEGEGLEHVATFTPDYQTVFPNGPDCSPQCPQATIVVEIP